MEKINLGFIEEIESAEEENFEAYEDYFMIQDSKETRMEFDRKYPIPGSSLYVRTGVWSYFDNDLDEYVADVVLTAVFDSAQDENEYIYFETSDMWTALYNYNNIVDANASEEVADADKVNVA